MLSYFTKSIYYYLGYEDEIKPDPKTLLIRNEMLKQIRLSKLKLKPIYKKQQIIQVNPICFKKIKKNKRTYSNALQNIEI